MWLYLIVAALVLLGAVGGVAFGGIFTIVLIPLALIVLFGGLLTAASGRQAQRRAGGATEESHVADRPLPRSHDRPSGRAPTSPEGLADARRAQQ
jgi:hypothetical protein